MFWPENRTQNPSANALPLAIMRFACEPKSWRLTSCMRCPSRLLREKLWAELGKRHRRGKTGIRFMERLVYEEVLTRLQLLGLQRRCWAREIQKKCARSFNICKFRFRKPLQKIAIWDGHPSRIQIQSLSVVRGRNFLEVWTGQGADAHKLVLHFTIL